ncbi:MAG: condensation domain-containing protein [Waterburya sp.]
MNRPLGSGEHIIWLYDQEAPLHFAIAGTIVGKFSDQQLESALIKVQQKHPLLQVCIKCDRDQQPWFVQQEGTIPLRIVEQRGKHNWQQEVELELTRPFIWYKAPLIRITLVRTTDFSTIIIVCHHSIADGLSASYLLRDILDAITEPDRQNLSLAKYPAYEELISNLPHLQSDQLPTEFKPDLSEQSIISSFNLEPQLISWSLPSSKTTSLIKRVRQEKTSIHGAVCAAFLLAIAKTKKLSTLKCQSPINVRKYLTPVIEEDFGFYYSIKITEHYLKDSSNIWEIARSVKEQLKEQMHPEQMFATIPKRQALMNTKPNSSLIKQIFLADENSYDLIVSNLGYLSFPQHYGTIELKNIYAPMVMTHVPDDLVVGVTGFGSEIFFTLTYSASETTAIKANRIKQEAMEQLDKALVEKVD